MNGVLYTVSKKPNSTAQPSGGTSITFSLKGACSVQAPVLSVAGGSPLNLFSASHIINGAYLNSSGALAASASYAVSDYIPVVPGHTYSVSRGASVSSSSRCWWYQADYSKLSAISGTGASLSLTAPSSATYLRISYLVAQQQNVSVQDPAYTGGPPSGNYVYIQAWSRYYWITDISYALGEWILTCKVDVLASYKSAIGSSSQYVLRAASDKDEYLIDSLYPTETRPTVEDHPINLNTAGKLSTSGVCILGVMGKNVSAAALASKGVTYYAMTESQMNSLVNWLNESAASALIADDFVTNFNLAGLASIVVDDIVQQFTKATDYIRSCLWLPIPSGYLTNGISAVEIRFGEYHTAGVTGYPLSQATVNDTWLTETLPAHPSAATLGAWLNSNPYTQHFLDIPYLGTIPLSSQYFSAGDDAIVTTDISCVDGSAQFALYRHAAGSGASDREFVGRYTAQVGIYIPLGQDSSSLLTAGMTMLSSVVSGLATKDVLGAANGIVTAVMAASPQPQGVTSGQAGFHVYGASQSAYRTSTFYTLSGTDNASHGSPLCQVKTISSLSGYILCEEAEISIPGTKQEADEVMAFMNGGFYYE